MTLPEPYEGLCKIILQSTHVSAERSKESWCER